MTEPTTLDEIAEWLRVNLRQGDYRLSSGESTYDIHILIALQQAYDLGQARESASADAGQGG